MNALVRVLALAAVAALFVGHSLAGEPVAVTVYRSPTCGCCSKWIEHLEANGFRVEARDVQDVAPFKRSAGVPPALASCHTAHVGGYVVEGHVPAADLRRLLAEQPPILGLAVPRMPVGSPGMEGPNPEPYEVLAFDGQGRVEVFSSYAP